MLATLFEPAAGRDAGFEVLSNVAADMGFPYVICAPVRNHPQADKNWAITSYPQKWRDLYAEKRYLERNPVRHHALVTARAFTWSALEQQLPERERDIFIDSRACGMVEGVVVPMHGPWGQAIAIGFATDSASAITPIATHSLQILANRFHAAYSDNCSTTNIRLTEREQEILLRVAQGYGGYQIAELLDLSPNSIEWHMKNIFRKLCVRSRTAAVVKAVQLGLVKM
jgi:LuxR family quorum-sensing system transcriptional regulator CciR